MSNRIPPVPVSIDGEVGTFLRELVRVLNGEGYISISTTKSWVVQPDGTPSASSQFILPPTLEFVAGPGTLPTADAAAVVQIAAGATRSAINSRTSSGWLLLAEHDTADRQFRMDLTTADLRMHHGVASGIGNRVFLRADGASLAAGSNAIAASSTSGFFYAPASSGTPSGTPAAISGFVPFYYDTGTNTLWIYNGGWKGQTFA